MIIQGDLCPHIEVGDILDKIALDQAMLLGKSNEDLYYHTRKGKQVSVI